MSVMFDQWHGKSYKCHSPSSSLWARINQSNLLGAMSRRPKQLRRIRRQDYNGVSDGKYKVSVISGETVNGEHVLQDKSGMLHAFDMTYGLDSDSRTQVRPDQWGCVSTCGGVRKARSASLPHSGQITWPPAGPGPSNSHLHEGHRHSLIIIFLCRPNDCFACA